MLVASQLTGVEDIFQGRAFSPLGATLANPAIGYRPQEQRYNPLSPTFLNVDSALSLSPILPTALPIEQSFSYTYSQHSTFGFERELGKDWAIAADYSFIRGAHIVRPRNINQGSFNLISSYERARTVCPALPGVAATGCSNPVYQAALTLRKRLARSHQLLASWTWSHAIDDATDVQTFEEPKLSRFEVED